MPASTQAFISVRPATTVRRKGSLLATTFSRTPPGPPSVTKSKRQVLNTPAGRTSAATLCVAAEVTRRFSFPRRTRPKEFRTKDALENWRVQSLAYESHCDVSRCDCRGFRTRAPHRGPALGFCPGG